MGRKPSKSTGKAKQSSLPVEKDDGTRWRIVGENGHPIYLANGGVTRSQAERLLDGLVTPGRLEQV